MPAARSAQRRAAAAAPAPDSPKAKACKGLARKLTQRPKRDARHARRSADAKGWEMKTLLAAVETSEASRANFSPAAPRRWARCKRRWPTWRWIWKPSAPDAAPGDEEWRRYLAGDRAVFARKLAAAIDDDAVDRITTLYREDARFHDAADAYLSEFEALAGARARRRWRRACWPRPFCRADTGKIYLADRLRAGAAYRISSAAARA